MGYVWDFLQQQVAGDSVSQVFSMRVYRLGIST